MEERRLFERTPLAAEVELVHAGEEGGGPARLRNISRSGAGLEISAPLPLDSVVSLRFSLLESDRQRVTEALTGRVVRCDAEGPSFAVGVQFIQPIHSKRAPLLYARLNQ